MNEEIEINDILTAMRERIGILAQENALLAAKIKKLENGCCNPNSSDNKND
jgi:hypothetical protein